MISTPNTLQLKEFIQTFILLPSEVEKEKCLETMPVSIASDLWLTAFRGCLYEALVRNFLF